MSVQIERPAASPWLTNSQASDAAMRRRLGAGAQALSRLFRWETIAAETLALYRAVGGDTE